MAKYLDLEGLQTYDQAIKNYIGDKIGSYSVGGDVATIKQYIDARVFAGTAAEIDVALASKRIDETTFTVVVDEEADELTSMTSKEINDLFK